MALIQCHFFSEVLQLSTSMTVILPQQTRAQIGMESKRFEGRHQTLYLLHGLSDDDTIWLRRTSIERYAASYGLAIVMPQVHRSFYTDMDQGGRYWTFLSEELPAIARSFFPLSDKREDNFAAGLSMGGYGAFKLALRNPGQYAAAASLSGALDMANHVKSVKDAGMQALYRQIYGSGDLAGTGNDLLWLLEQGSGADKQKPKLFLACGTEDFLYEENLRFSEAAAKTDFDLTQIYDPGSHEWGYWDEKIQRVLEWLPLRK